MDSLDALRAFRDSLYRCFDRRADALFELTDALLTAGAVPSPVHLSLEPSHRRGWGSLYAALDRGRIDPEALRELLARHPLASSGGEPPVYAVDVSVWSRCDAESSPGRGFYYHPSRHSAGQPIVAGWAYQWFARLGFARESWVAPVDVRRVHPAENANEVAARQVKLWADRLPEREGVPLFVFDAGYDPVQLQQGLAGGRAAILVRLRAGRCFYAEPEGPPARTGRPRRHGRKLECKNPATWPEPTAEHACEDAGYGAVRVRAWAGLHPKTQNHPTHGTRRPAPSHAGRWSWLRSRGSRVVIAGASRGFCGCGGTAPTVPPRTWTSCGAPTCGASTWSIPSASSSRRSGGPPRGCAARSRPTCGRGWCSPPSRSCAWRGRAWRTGGFPGRGATPPTA